mgnify:CR=1 FL=1
MEKRKEGECERVCVCVCMSVCVRVRLIVLDRIKERKDLAFLEIEVCLYVPVDNRNSTQPLARTWTKCSISLFSSLSTSTFDFAMRGTESSQIT